jgi:hypothetical protein
MIIHWYQKGRDEWNMGIFDELNKSLKQSKNELKEGDVNRQLKELGLELGKAGRELSSESGKTRGTAGQPAALPGQIQSQTESARNPHKGYSRLAAWVKTKHSSRIKAISDPYQQKLVLELISNDACCELPEKTKNGFLAYLKNQNYEQLLKK